MEALIRKKEAIMDRQAAGSVPADAMAVEQLKHEVARLEGELDRYLDARPSASAGGPSGGPGGGGIDPDKLHEMYRKMDASFGFAEKKERLRTLRLRLNELSGG